MVARNKWLACQPKPTGRRLVLPAGIEPATSSLPMKCSTAELWQLFYVYGDGLDPLLSASPPVDPVRVPAPSPPVDPLLSAPPPEVPE